MQKKSNLKVLPLWRTSNVNKQNNSKQLFLLIDVKSKQRYKVKINKMQWYDPYQMKKEELSGDIGKFLPVQ